MSTLTRAILLATQNHDGQLDKGGKPYILHPLRIMLQAAAEDERITAVLHDIVEDTPVTLEDLRAERFDERIVSAIDCLTRRPEETYEQFIERIRGNELACSVKLLDLEDNSDLSRIGQPSEKDQERLERYRRAIEVLRKAKFRPERFTSMPGELKITFPAESGE